MGWIPRVIAAYGEATNKPFLVVHPKDNVVRSFNASSHNEAVCLVFENQHYELLLTQDCDLQAIWQHAEDGGHRTQRSRQKQWLKIFAHDRLCVNPLD